MSNPSQEKAPALQWEQAKEDKRNLTEQTSLTQDRLQDSVHDARAEQAKPKEKESTMLTGSVEVNWIDDGHGRRFKVEKVKSTHDQNKDNMQDRSNTSYPEAQMAHDAKGRLHHIDFESNKNR